MKTRILLLLLFSAAVPATVLAQANGPSLTFAFSSIEVSGVPPSHDVLVFSIAREQRPYWVNVAQRQRILSGPLTNGARTWDLGQRIPPKSIWCAVDLATADYAVAEPPGFHAAPISPSPLFSRSSAASAIESVEHDRVDAIIILAHPGSGAWTARNADGGTTDTEKQNGRTALRFESMQPVAKTIPPPPHTLAPNDTVIIIDPMYMQTWSGRVGREIQP